MKNFEWKDENQNKQDGPEPDPQVTPPEEIAKLMWLSKLFDIIYNVLNWFQMGVAIIAIFAWLWQTDKAPFVTFLFFALYAVEKVVDLADASVDWSVRVYAGGDGDDGGDANGNDNKGDDKQ